MTRKRVETLFSAREMRYLQSLPAVDHVTPNRITYTEDFKRDCVRRYLAGESPSVIFRNAGLDSSLIGYKRIERSIARWRGQYAGVADSADSTSRSRALEVPESQRWSGTMASRSWDDARADDDFNAYRLIIVQQARRIAQLERELEASRRGTVGVGAPGEGNIRA